MTPQCVPVVEPLRQIAAPIGASSEPATGTTPVDVATTGCGVQSPFTSTKPKSPVPGKTDAFTVPWAASLNPVVVLPGAPQCPAVMKPPSTEKPTEQRNWLSMKYGSAPRTSNNGCGVPAAVTTRTSLAGTSPAAIRLRAAAAPPG